MLITVDAAKEIFENSGINVTSEGRKHLGAYIGSESFKLSFVDQAVYRNGTSFV